MNIFRSRPEQMWSLGWVFLIRLVLYLVIGGFFLQHLYFESDLAIGNPREISGLLAGLLLLNFALLLVSFIGWRTNFLVVLSFVFDLLILTRLIVSSGGFNSVLIPYYLPILVMAPAWLPRRFTAVFPSIATLGIAYIGLAHLLASNKETQVFPWLYRTGVVETLKVINPHTIVANMLLLSVLFFVVSYLAGFLSDKWFLEQRLNSEVLSSMKEGVAVIDSRERVVFINSEFRRLFPGIGQTNDMTPLLEELFPGCARGKLMDVLPRAVLEDNLVVKRVADDTVPSPPMEIRVSGLSLPDQNSLFGLVFLVSDLTLRRRMERVERELTHYSSISTMAAGLAHEIRNPLASLRSAIQEIGATFPKDSENRVLTDIVIAESDRLDGVIGRFLDFSREGELRLGRCRLSELLEDTRTLVLRDKAPDEFAIDLQVISDTEITADSDRLREVFLNLALNASQVAPKKGGRLTIVVEHALNDGLPGMEVLFMDNGPGIDDTVKPHIFEPFFTSRSGGTGMGLPLSRKQVLMHGGEISAENLPEGGACFRVWLPLAASKRPRDTGSRRKLSERWT